jgi:exonuclease III
VASVHALADLVEVGTAVTPADHERIRRTGLDRATYNDVLVAALEPWVAGGRFLVGGDWNDSPLFDTYYPKGAYGVAGSSIEFFERRKRAGWCDAMRRFHVTDIKTYLDPKSAPYELDHVFTDADTYGQLVKCHVLDDVAVMGLSDHAPLVIEFAI